MLFQTSATWIQLPRCQTTAAPWANAGTLTWRMDSVAATYPVPCMETILATRTPATSSVVPSTLQVTNSLHSPLLFGGVLEDIMCIPLSSRGASMPVLNKFRSYAEFNLHSFSRDLHSEELQADCINGLDRLVFTRVIKIWDEMGYKERL